MLDLVGWLLVLASLAALPLVAVRLLRDAPVARRTGFSVHALGEYEAQLPILRRVVVVCHGIEDPKDALREAVKGNFARGVQYLFLVSKSRANKELERGFRIFEVLARFACDEGAKPVDMATLLDIKSLPYEWDDTPYIFYELDEPDRPDVRRVVAVRGNQIKEGIAAAYTVVAPRSAKTILRAVMAGAPFAFREGETVEYGDAPHLSAARSHIEKETRVH
jgi:hypothetical protein